MTEFNQVFDGGLAERVFLIVSIIFMVLYACGILFMWRTESRSRRTVFYGRTAIMALFLAVWRFPLCRGIGAVQLVNERCGQ